MHIQPISTMTHNTIDKLLSAIAFFQQVKQRDPYQYELLLLHSRLEEFVPGDRVICQGNQDAWVYFLLRGQLDVLKINAEGTFHLVNQVTPGEVFGSLSNLLNVPRTASVYVEDGTRGAMVFGTDFSVFGELEDLSTISLTTKLLYYQNLVHSFRWQLESYKIKYPEHSLADCHRKIKLFVGKKGTIEELKSLETQGRALAQLIVEWNRKLLNATLNVEKHVYL